MLFTKDVIFSFDFFEKGYSIIVKEPNLEFFLKHIS
jgi:hypothetical protein